MNRHTVVQKKPTSEGCRLKGGEPKGGGAHGLARQLPRLRHSAPVANLVNIRSDDHVITNRKKAENSDIR